MASSFAASRDRVNRAVFQRLWNAGATLDGYVRGIFDDGHSVGGVGAAGMAGTQPTFTLLTASLVGEPVGKSIVVNGFTYVVGAHEPDGTGVSRLFLERTA